MHPARSPIQLLRACGLAMCLLSGAFSLFELLAAHAPERTPGCVAEVFARRWGWNDAGVAALEAALVVGFAALFWRGTRPDQLGKWRGKALPLLAAETALSFVAATELMALVSFSAPLMLGPGAARSIVLVMAALHTSEVFLQTQLTGLHPLARLVAGADQHVPQFMLLMAATSAIYHGLAFSLGLFGTVERQRAQELARANAELRATRRLEAETARVGVRLGISRELHDASGHHMAALSVNLRLMRRLHDPQQISQKVEECLGIVDQLLHDVRGVVRDLRSLQRIDLRQILATMCAGFEGTQVLLDLDDQLAEAEPYYAHTLFRCCQEILTNAVKHSGANHIWLSVRETPDGYLVEGRDDGRGVGEFRFGTGLTGMRERVTELGGDFHAESRAGEGFRLRLRIPVRRQAA